LRAVRRLIVISWVVLSVVAPAADAACGGVKTAHPSRHAVPGRPPHVIGDSVLLGAVDEVAGVGYEVNTRGCRQMSEGLRVIAAKKRAGRLPSLVVLMLGANWTIQPSEIRQAMRLVGPGRVLGLVTPREEGGGSGSDARVVRAAGRRHTGRVVVLDWVAYTAGHSGWFAPDGLHLGPGGAQALARLLRTALPYANPLDGRWAPTSGAAPADAFSASAD
jgi:lysophospholipase L1-like esterase